MPALLVLLALALFPVTALAKDALPNVLPPNAPDTWRKQCTSCHGRNGAGQTSMGRMHKAEDLTDPEFHRTHSDEKIRKIIADGSPTNRMMRGYGKAMSAEEIDELVKFIRTLDRSKQGSSGKTTAAGK